MSDFERDDKWQRHMRDSVLAPLFYGKYAVEGRYVFIDKGRLAKQLQRDNAVDTIVQGKDGEAICIEEKIVRWPARGEPYTAYALETWSCTNEGHEKPGWMKYGRADYLLYCFADASETALECHLIDFPALQAWFWPRAEFYPGSRTKQFNHSECRIVPFEDVREAVGVSVWRLGDTCNYDAEDDFARSIDHCYAAVRARRAAGGPGWPEEGGSLP